MHASLPAHGICVWTIDRLMHGPSADASPSQTASAEVRRGRVRPDSRHRALRHAHKNVKFSSTFKQVRTNLL